MNDNYNDDYENFNRDNYDDYPDESYGEFDDYHEGDFIEDSPIKYVEPEFIDRSTFEPNSNLNANEYFDDDSTFEGEYYDEYDDNGQYEEQNIHIMGESRSERLDKRENLKKSRRRGKKKLAVKFAIVFGSIMLVFVLVVTGVWFGFRPSGEDGRSVVVGFFERVLGADEEALIDMNLLPPVKTNVLILGNDDEASLTDAMFLATFDRETLKIDIISLPRDSWVTLDEDIFERFRSQWGSRSMRINAIYNRAESGEGGELVKLHVERMLGINIHHWVAMDLVGFRAVVDAMGGVEMEIRPQGLHYFDPVANFRINVPGGLQVLDGVAAEGVVRFRADYAGGDLARINMQKEFMVHFMDQLLQRDVLINNALNFLGIMISYVDTDFNVIFDLPKYIAYIPQISTENLHFHMLPGEPRTIYPGGVRTAVYQLDMVATRDLIDKIFFAPPEIPEEDEPEQVIAPIDRANTRIQILNGAGVSGLAATFRDRLSVAGFNIASVDNYVGSASSATRIVVRTPGLSYDLSEYFNSIVEELNSDLLGDYDIVIIIGTGDR